MDPYSQTASQLATLAPLLTIVSALSLLGLLAGIALDYAGDFAPAPTIGGWERAHSRARVVARLPTAEDATLSARAFRACQHASATGRPDLADRAVGAWCAGDYRRALSLAGASVRWAPATAATEAPMTEAPIIAAPMDPYQLALVPVLNYRRPALFAPPARVALVDERPPTSWERFAHPIAVGGAA